MKRQLPCLAAPRRPRCDAGIIHSLLVALAAGACASEPPPADSERPARTSELSTDAPGLPGHAPERFGFGADASPERVALWDIDIKPDGEGLPPGSGSVADGRRVYEVSCLQCHGPTGTEGPNDRLVSADEWEQWPPGRAVGMYWPYATTLFDYTRRSMPQTTPGTLSGRRCLRGRRLRAPPQRPGSGGRRPGCRHSRRDRDAGAGALRSRQQDGGTRSALVEGPLPPLACAPPGPQPIVTPQ